MDLAKLAHMSLGNSLKLPLGVVMSTTWLESLKNSFHVDSRWWWISCVAEICEWVPREKLGQAHFK